MGRVGFDAEQSVAGLLVEMCEVWGMEMSI